MYPSETTEKSETPLPLISLTFLIPVQACTGGGELGQPPVWSTQELPGLSNVTA